MSVMHLVFLSSRSFFISSWPYRSFCNFGMLGCIVPASRSCGVKVATFRDERNLPSRHWHHITLPESSKRMQMSQQIGFAVSQTGEQ